MEECHKMLTDQIGWANLEDLDYLRYGSKGSRPALLISKMKAAHYLDFGLELLIPEHMWIDDVCTYDISASYEKDFKNLYPNDFEDLNLLLLQGHLNHLSGSDKRMLSTSVKMWTHNIVIRQRVKDLQIRIESYQTQLNLTKPGWDAKGYEVIRMVRLGTCSHDPDRTGGSTQGHPLDSVEVHRYDKRRKSKNKGIVSTNMDLELEQTQQGSSHEFSVSTEGVEE
ncbi:hypothetical protein Tco_1218946 [Tanacetum coccineum]